MVLIKEWGDVSMKEKKDKKIVIFDVCGTLYNSNTTFDYIRFVCKDSLILKILNIFIIKYLILLTGKVTGRDVYRLLYIYQLRGMEYSELDMAAENFVNYYLHDKIISETHELLAEELNKGTRVLLCSASLEPIIKVIAKKLGVLEYKCSSLCYEDSKCRGKLERDLLGRKHVHFGKINLVVTDNLSDLRLVQQSENSFIVAKQKNIAFWKSNNINVDLIL